MLLPAAVRPYAADVDGTASRVRCAIALNGSKDLRIQLCGRLKRGFSGEISFWRMGTCFALRFISQTTTFRFLTADATAMRMCWMASSRPR